MGFRKLSQLYSNLMAKKRDKQQILMEIEALRDKLIKLEAKQVTLQETVAYCQQRWERLQHQKKLLHDEVTKLKVKILKMDL